jgi:hypothetical protein
MSEKKEASAIKNLMLRLPSDQYVMLKALAQKHGNSLNTEVLEAINLAATSEKGLYVPHSELSPEASNMLRASNVPASVRQQKMYLEASAFSADPLDVVRDNLEDWLAAHGAMRYQLAQLALVVEVMDEVMRGLKKPDKARFLLSTPETVKPDVIEMIESTQGVPALRKAYQNYLSLVEQLQKSNSYLEQIQASFDRNLHWLHQKSDGSSPWVTKE